MKVKDFAYDLPKDLIASYPLKNRDMSRLLVIKRASGGLEEKLFKDVGEYLSEGDCLVVNNTRVVPARLYGRRKTGGKTEIFLIEPFADPPTALVRSSKKIANGEEIELEGGHIARILGPAQVGRYVRFSAGIVNILASGHVPLPPYISRGDNAGDRESYQTVYAKNDGATAAPTAGLHFTEALLDRLAGRGINVVPVTLHTSYGTFSPVKVSEVKDHKMHGERYEISPETCEAVNAARARGCRVVAVGTTSVRVLETCAGEDGNIMPSSGISKLFIYPGYRFKIVDALITNFHLPGSTLLMLVSAFAGRELIMKAYSKAIKDRYRFFSYGDATLII